MSPRSADRTISILYSVMSVHPYGPIPTTRSELLELFRARRGEFTRLNALVSAGTLLGDVITALELHYQANEDATTDLAGALAHSHASQRSLRRWVKEGVVRKSGDRYVIATLPVLTATARVRTDAASRTRTAPREATAPGTSGKRTRITATYSVADAAERLRADTARPPASARRKESR